MKESHFTESDRALIIKLSVQVERAISDIAELKGKYERREEDFLTKEDAKKFITEDQFSPIRKLVYGATGIMLTAILGAIVYVGLKFKI